MDASGRFRRSANANANDMTVPALSPSSTSSLLLQARIFFPIHQIKQVILRECPPLGLGGPRCANLIPCELFSISFRFCSFTVMCNG
ncbi:hypothetical protein M3I53_05300 [Paraburkholderia sp. CNPSo 3272]|uniref:hypothetical protein n=1 Tax=Paraburkholderia sp. CNPSo 3272 TaxID=2940931 RepID=UPI0020B8FE9A|nr:hypothetical protein [Paraburkholderia sp. CNPSo 3272]MCP3722553.1 hypothetical protein [Paraburkholderia sp. CNPSo 3272]